MKLSTFSIVARDPETGLMGVAGGTNWFGYGRWVIHAEAGGGVLATQAETNMWYAPNGLEDLKNGKTAQESVEDLLRRDSDTDGVYQLLILDTIGNTFCHSGDNCYDYAGSIGEPNLGVAGNTLVSEETLKAVVEYYKNSTEPFEHKIIKSLQAGQKAGGDIRGMKSAAIKVVKGKSSGKFWEDTVLDLRVEENEDPLTELERLYRVAEAYRYVDKAQSTNNLDEAMEFYTKGLELDPNNSEIRFWMARIYASKGNITESDKLRKIIRPTNANWDEYWKRLDKKNDKF